MLSSTMKDMEIDLNILSLKNNTFPSALQTIEIINVANLMTQSEISVLSLLIEAGLCNKHSGWIASPISLSE